MSILKSIFFSILISFILVIFQKLIDSNYIIDFLSKNLITILIALLAINLTTLSIVLTKIRELIELHGNKANFNNTKNEMLLSIKEQLILIIFSLIILSILKSKWILLNYSYIDLIDILTISCLIYSLLILYDTAKSIFIIIDFK